MVPVKSFSLWLCLQICRGWPDRGVAPMTLDLDQTGDIGALQSNAAAAVAEGRLADAAKAYSSLVGLLDRPDFETCRNALVLSFENGLVSTAAKIGSRIVRLHPDSAELIVYHAAAAYQVAPDEVSYAWFRTNLKQYPRQWGSIYRAFKDAARMQSREAEAIEDLQSIADELVAANDNPSAYASALYELVNLLHVTQPRDEARLDQALRLAHDHSPDLFDLVRYADASGRVAKSLNPESDEQREARLEALNQGIVDFLAGRQVNWSSLASAQFRDDVSALLESYTVIATPDIDRARPALLAGGLSDTFLDGLKAGPAAYVDAISPREADKAWRWDEKVQFRIRDILDTLDRRYKVTLSPYGTGLAQSVRMAGVEVFAFPQEDRSFAVAQWCEADRYLSDTVWIFPKLRTVLFFRESKFSAKTITAFVHRLFVNFVRFPALTYPRSDAFDGSIHVVAPVLPHIGHYIWNAISGWSPFFRYAKRMDADGLAVYQNLSIICDVRDLYPEQIKRPLLLLDDEHDANLRILAGETILTLKSNYITEELANRVMIAAADKAKGAIIEEARALRKRCFPLVLVTLRLGNRSWIGQAEGLRLMMEGLHAEFPSIGFILDGINSGVSQGWTHAFMSVQEEIDMAQSIIDRLDPDVMVLNSINCSGAESIVLSQMADAFIAPVGAGMAKYRWIANLPGVAYSNRIFSADDHLHGHLYDYYREHARAARHLPAELVKDIAVAGMEASRSNFELDWRDLKALASEHFRELFFQSKAADETLADAGLRPLARRPQITTHGKPSMAGQYQHYISLGSNCEIAFQFRRVLQQDSSSFFSWNVTDCSALLRLLKTRFEGVAELGNIRPHSHPSMLLDTRYDYLFHNPFATGEPSEDPQFDTTWAAYRSKVEYLVAKFLRDAASDDRTAYFYKTDEEDVRGKARLIRDALQDLHPKDNFDLVIIQTRDREEADWGETRLRNRYVRRFAPFDDATDGHVSSYDAIFREFPKAVTMYYAGY